MINVEYSVQYSFKKLIDLIFNLRTEGVLNAAKKRVDFESAIRAN